MAAVFMAVGLVLGGLSPARGASSPCVTAGNFGWGALQTNHTSYGARANITKQDPNICGSTSTAVAWSMEASGDGLGWAQVGYGRFGSNTFPGQPAGFSFFAQVKRDLNYDPNTTITGTAPTGNHLYKVDYVFSTGVLRMWAASTLVASSSSGWDPAIQWSSPWDPQFAGETLHTQSDMPGIASNHVQITHMNRRLNQAGDWDQLLNPLILTFPDGAPSRYHAQWITNPVDFEIWTNPL